MPVLRIIIASVLALAAVAAGGVAPVAAVEPDAVYAIEVAGGAEAVGDPLVSVAVTTTDSSVTTLRISLDGATWREEPLSGAVGLSLVDPALGGIDVDHQVTVRVAFGDGAIFGQPVSVTLWLDRQAPAWDAFSLWSPWYAFDPPVDTGLVTDTGSGFGGWRYTFDNVHWADWRTANVLDFRDPAAGGSWTQDTRQAWVQARDRAGNESPVYPASTVLQVDPYYDLPATMEYPLPAVTGQPFTAKPLLPLGMVPPPNAWCYWDLSWGNDDAIFDRHWDATWGTIQFWVKATKGGCGPWTFTLPFAPTLKYRLQWSMCVHVDTSCQGTSMTDDVFTARWASSDRHIPTSNLPFAYILPSKLMTAVGEPITYRLHTAGGYEPPAKGTIWTSQCDCRLGPFPIQRGGSSFTFTPDTVGDWPVWWNGPGGLFENDAGYDPAARRRDTSAPTTSTPVARIGGAVPDGRVPVTVSWTSRDAGWGVDRNKLWKSIDGGPWVAVRLERPRSTSAQVWLQPGDAVRFRVRSIDRAGNAGAYDVGPVFRPALVADGSAAIAYRGTWTTLADDTALGGSLRASDVAGAGARLVFSGRGVAWIAPRGAGFGIATVKIDGKVAATVDLRASAAAPHRIVFARHWAVRGAHTISITVAGTAGRPTIGVDGFAILR
jgi:hypothetical protein